LRELRAEDVIGRIGGEEFAAVMWNVTQEDTLATANRVRIAFANTAEAMGVVLGGVTVSAGIAMTGEDDQQDVEALLARADDALYSAKSRGRNRVELAPTPPARVTPLDPARRKQMQAGAAEPMEGPSLVPDQLAKRTAVSAK
jgi:hypothetical protein